MFRRFMTAIAVAALLVAGAAGPARAGDIIWTGKPAGAEQAPQHIRKPLAVGKDGKSARLAGGVFHYAGMHQWLGNGSNNTGATVVAALASQHNPYLNTAQFGHTLYEVAAQSYDQQQTVEIGWTVDDSLYGNTSTRLFCASWVNGAFNGYAKSGSWNGFVDNPSEAVGCGTALAVTALGSAPSNFYQYKILRQSTNSWDGAANPGWRLVQQNMGNSPDRVIGVYPDTVWTGASPSVTTFDEVGLLQIFGETVSSTVDNPCHDMGSGIFATSTDPSGAAVNIAHSANAPGETNVPDAVNVNPSSDSPGAYRVYQFPADLDKWKFGGIGFNSSGTTSPAGTLNGC